MPASLLTVTPLTASGISHVFDNIPYGPTVWLDASKIAGISSGASLSAWTDVSGNGNTVTQASAASQPVYVTNQLNGLPVVQFAGAQQFTGGDVDLATAGHTLIALSSFSTAPTGAQYGIISKGIGASGQQYSLCITTARKLAYFFYTGAAQRSAAETTAQSVNSYKANTILWTGSNYSFYVNGAADGSTTTDAFGAQQNSNLLIGGSTDGNNSFFSGNVAEILIYNRALTATELGMVHSYLTTKWAV